MKDINPAPLLLLAIVVLCAIYAATVLVNERLASVLNGTFIPIIMTLLALKVEVVRRNMVARAEQTDKKINGVQLEMTERAIRAERRAAELEAWVRAQHKDTDVPGQGPTKLGDGW